MISIGCGCNANVKYQGLEYVRNLPLGRLGYRKRTVTILAAVIKEARLRKEIRL